MGIDREYLRKVLTFWEKLSEEEKDMILNNTVKASYRQGEQVHSADQECVGVLIIRSGELRTYILSEEGKEVTLYRQGEGEVSILTASCVLSSIHFDVHVDAEKDSDVLVINAPAFSRLCESNVYIENFSLRLATERFSDVMWAMEQILFTKDLLYFFWMKQQKRERTTLRLPMSRLQNTWEVQEKSCPVC